MRIVFVRHGKPDYKFDNLTPEGKIQAAAVAKRVKDEGIARLFSSPCGRAYETAEYISKEINKDITVLDFMHEISWGNLDGSNMFSQEKHPWDTVEKIINNGETLLDTDVSENKYFKDNYFCKCYNYVSGGMDAFLKENGFERSGLYYNCENPKQKEETVCIVSHGGASSVVLSHMLNLPILLVLKIIRPRFTAVTVLHLPEKKGLVTPKTEILNDARHITDTEIYYGN